MKTNSRFLFAASLGLALVFTFSCSGDSNDNSGGGGGSSQPNINSAGPVQKEQISGVSQKGPFMRGSTAVLYELDDRFVQTGRSFRDIIADDKGSFDIKINVELVSPYAMLEVDGYYRNEVTGNPSTGTIKLYAIADIREKSNVNVNILTHLEYYRVQKLVEEGKSLKDAKKQAQKEILAIFGISGDFKDSEDMSIFGTSDGDAALLAISVLLQGDLSEAQFVERLTDFRLGFKETGAWNSNAAKDAMANWAWAAGGLGGIRDNILRWNLSSSVPDFEKFVNNYWYASYGLGVCDAEKEGEFKSYTNTDAYGSNTYYYTCKNKVWEKADKYDHDIYQLGACSKEGDVKAVQPSGTKYICKDMAWVDGKYIEIKCSESKSCLTFTDTHDNQTYVYVKIGEQTWMAENLNYNASGSICAQASCYKYGRLYNWETAKKSCPDGWHLPNNEEWQELIDFAGGSEVAGTKLKATSDWDYSGGIRCEGGCNNGTDDYGFAALPGGFALTSGAPFSMNVGIWWSDSEYNTSIANFMRMFPFEDFHLVDGEWLGDDANKGSFNSVRCLKNKEFVP